MDTAIQNKSERINLRLKSSVKSCIERAASFEGKSVSHFILSSTLDRAEKTVKAHETMSLNLKDSEIFFEALTNPARFNSELSEAFKEHERRVVSR